MFTKTSSSFSGQTWLPVSENSLGSHAFPTKIRLYQFYSRFVFDTTFARHLSLVEGRHEFYEKAPSYKGKERATSPSPKSFPLLASACPGWICYAEKTHGELLPYISNVKSPQQVMGSLVKEWLGPKLGLTRDQIYHVSVMPCYDKKLEASRPDFATESGNRDVDCVLTTGEVQRILNEKGIDVTSMLDISEPEAQEMVFPSLLSGRGSASGGYLHNIIIAAIKGQPQSTLASLVLDIRHIRGEDYVEYILRSSASVVFRGAKCYGFRNLQNVVRKVGREAGITVSKGAAGRSIVTKPPGLSKRMTRVPGEGREGDSRELERGYDFIEVMACPSGCVNGGGQISPPKHPLPIEIDSEGMPIIASDAGEYKVVADPQGHRVLSGKDWVARVEEFYWRLGATKIMEQGSANLPSVHDSIRPYLESLVEETTRNQFAEKILGEMTSGHANPDEERQRILRTQYRAIESEEVNGLAVKW